MLKIHSSQFILPKAADAGGDYVTVSAARQSVKYIIDQFRARPKTWDIPRCITVLPGISKPTSFHDSAREDRTVSWTILS